MLASADRLMEESELQPIPRVSLGFFPPLWASTFQVLAKAVVGSLELSQGCVLHICQALYYGLSLLGSRKEGGAQMRLPRWAGDNFWQTVTVGLSKPERAVPPPSQGKTPETNAQHF